MDGPALESQKGRETILKGKLEPLNDGTRFREVISSQPVTFADCRALARLGEERGCEYFMATFSSKDGNNASYYSSGYQRTCDFGKFDYSGLCFQYWPRINTHVHPLREKLNEGGQIPDLVLPSGGSIKNSEGDFAVHQRYYRNGGCLNIASYLGLSLYMGVRKINHISPSDIGWKIISGSQQGVRFPENGSTVCGGLGKDNAVLLEHLTPEGLLRYFVFARWEEIEKAAEKGITYQGLCFQDHLRNFLNQIGIDLKQIPTLPRNLDDLCRQESLLIKDSFTP